MLEIRNRKTLQSKIKVCKNEVKIGDCAYSLTKKHNTHHIDNTDALHITLHNAKETQPSTTFNNHRYTTNIHRPLHSHPSRHKSKHARHTYRHCLSAPCCKKAIIKYCAHTHCKSAAPKRTYLGTRVNPSSTKNK